MRIAAGLFVLFFARGAFAEDADALIEEGIALREHGKDEEALGRFERAYAIAPSARAKAQIGLCEQALGRWAAAERDVAIAIAQDDPWITKNKIALDGALVTIRAHLGDLVVTGEIPNAVVRIDGGSAGTLPLRTRLEIGTHTVEVTAPKHYPFSRLVTIDAGTPARVSVEMRPRIVEDDGPTPTITTSTTGNTQRAVGIALAISTAVPLVFGFVGIGARASQISSYNADPSCPGIDQPNKPAPCQSRVDAADTWQTVSILGFVFAGALAVTSAIVILTAPSNKTVSARGLTLTF